MEDLVIIIVLNYNQNEYTLSCIDSVLKSDYPNYRIILIDNGSTEENYIELESKLPRNEKLIFKRIKDNVGYVGGSNFGFVEGRKMNPKYFVVMNNDTILDNEAISELVKESKKCNDNAIITGKVYHYDKPEILQLIGFKYTKERYFDRVKLGTDELDTGQYDEVREMDMMDDIVGLYPTELYDKIGGYSNYFWINGEQFDLALRAQREGYKLIYTPKVKVWHKGSVSFGGRVGNPRLVFWEMQGSLTLRYLHLNMINFLSFYLLMLRSIIGTYIRATYLIIFKTKNTFKYANAKFLGLLYFNKWVIIKNENTGYNPFSK